MQVKLRKGNSYWLLEVTVMCNVCADDRKLPMGHAEFCTFVNVNLAVQYINVSL